MERLRVKEKYQDLFTHIKTANNLLIFDYISDTSLNVIFNANYGNRFLTEFANDNDVDTVAKAIADLYGKKWNSLLTEYLSSIDSLSEFAQVYRETVRSSNNGSMDRNTVSKVSAFNDVSSSAGDDFIDNNSDNETSTTTDTGEKVREYTLQKVKDSKHYADVLNYLQKNIISDIIFTDINSMLTLCIFDLED